MESREKDRPQSLRDPGNDKNFDRNEEDESQGKGGPTALCEAVKIKKRNAHEERRCSNSAGRDYKWLAGEEILGEKKEPSHLGEKKSMKEGQTIFCRVRKRSSTVKNGQDPNTHTKGNHVRIRRGKSVETGRGRKGGTGLFPKIPRGGRD